MLVTRNPSGKGLHCEFKNGCVLSIQWNEMNYAVEGESVEVAAWEPSGNWIDLPDSSGADTIVGWVPLKEVGKFMDIVRAYDLTFVQPVV